MLLPWRGQGQPTLIPISAHLPGVPDEEQLFKKPRQVVHKNTRFLKDPFSQALSRSQLQQAAALNAQVGGLWGSKPRPSVLSCPPKLGPTSGSAELGRTGVIESLWVGGAPEAFLGSLGTLGWHSLAQTFCGSALCWLPLGAKMWEEGGSRSHLV